MASFNPNIEGLNELSDMFDNILNQANSFEGELVINIENIKNNIDSFNDNFDTSFSKNTSEDELQKYFQEEYISLMQEHLTDNVNYKAHFNNIYTNYAHIE